MSSGQTNVSIQEKNMSIYFGNDFHNTQCINFVSLASNNADHIINVFQDVLFKLYFV